MTEADKRKAAGRFSRCRTSQPRKKIWQVEFMSSFVGEIFGAGGVGEAIKSISDDVGKLIPDATVREQVQAALVAKQQELTKQANDYEQARVLAETDIQKAQIDIDKTQVTSTGGYRTIEKLKGVASASDPPQVVPSPNPKA